MLIDKRKFELLEWIAKNSYATDIQLRVAHLGNLVFPPTMISVAWNQVSEFLHLFEPRKSGNLLYDIEPRKNLPGDTSYTRSMYQQVLEPDRSVQVK